MIWQETIGLLDYKEETRLLEKKQEQQTITNNAKMKTVN